MAEAFCIPGSVETEDLGDSGSGELEVDEDGEAKGRVELTWQNIDKELRIAIGLPLDPSWGVVSHKTPRKFTTELEYKSSIFKTLAYSEFLTTGVIDVTFISPDVGTDSAQGLEIVFKPDTAPRGFSVVLERGVETKSQEVNLENYPDISAGWIFLNVVEAVKKAGDP